MKNIIYNHGLYYKSINCFEAETLYRKGKRVEYLHNSGNWIPLPMILNKFDYTKKYRIRMNDLGEYV